MHSRCCEECVAPSTAQSPCTRKVTRTYCSNILAVVHPHHTAAAAAVAAVNGDQCMLCSRQNFACNSASEGKVYRGRMKARNDPHHKTISPSCCVQSLKVLLLPWKRDRQQGFQYPQKDPCASARPARSAIYVEARNLPHCMSLMSTAEPETRTLQPSEIPDGQRSCAYNPMPPMPQDLSIHVQQAMTGPQGWQPTTCDTVHVVSVQPPSMNHPMLANSPLSLSLPFRINH